ncbi:hypothetical protein DXG01_016339 [Tephrocybe rancida]|nr:hypothetical protein DXG01_016339 [Tephrocybe rancida]
MDGKSSSNPLYDPAALNDALRRYVPFESEQISYAMQLDSLKSRLQTTKTPITIPRLASLVYREEGIMGFYRGLWIPLMTISFVRTCRVLFRAYYDFLPTLDDRRGQFHDIHSHEGKLSRPQDSLSRQYHRRGPYWWCRWSYVRGVDFVHQLSYVPLAVSHVI